MTVIPVARLPAPPQLSPASHVKLESAVSSFSQDPAPGLARGKWTKEAPYDYRIVVAHHQGEFLFKNAVRCPFISYTVRQIVQNYIRIQCMQPVLITASKEKQLGKIPGSVNHAADYQMPPHAQPRLSCPSVIQSRPLPWRTTIQIWMSG